MGGKILVFGQRVKRCGKELRNSFGVPSLVVLQIVLGQFSIHMQKNKVGPL